MMIDANKNNINLIQLYYDEYSHELVLLISNKHNNEYVFKLNNTSVQGTITITNICQ